MKTMTFAVMVAISCSAYGSGRAYLSVKVVDSDSGKPIPNMNVHGGFLNYSPRWGVAAKDNSDDRITDRNGFCRLTGLTEKGEACCIVRGNDGYYDSGWYSYDYSEQSFLKLGRWLPDDIVVTARLDRIINPIPLFVKNVFGAYRERNRRHFAIHADNKDLSVLAATNDVPIVSNVTMAYDLCKGAWLPPYGEGKVADILFTYNETVMGWRRYGGGGGVSLHKMYKMNAMISISGNGNGMVEIVPGQNVGIKLRTAPLEGYVQNCSRWRGWFGGGDGTKTDCDKSRCYAFRIRTVYDENGNIKSAYYGKIYDDFDLSGLDGVRFLYYLNPTPNDRNLEWDMKNNLCPKPGDIGNPRP